MNCPSCGHYPKTPLAVNVAVCQRCGTLYDPRNGKLVRGSGNGQAPEPARTNPRASA